MLRVAVTGGIACGKSLAGACLMRRGFAVCEADKLAHRVMMPGQPAHDAVVGRFGEGILGQDGRIDRKVLGGMVFGDEERLAALNAAVHPHVFVAWQNWLAGIDGKAVAAAVVIPLLYEAGQGAGWDAVICVASPRCDQVRRLKERGLSEEAARLRIKAQMPLEQKVNLADYVVVNTGAAEALEEQVNRVVDTILKR